MWIYFFLITLSLCAEKGVDVSTLFKESEMKCVKEKGNGFFIPRCYESAGQADPNCGANLKNAKAAGLKTDVYMFPCVHCGNPEKQAEEAIKAAGSNHVGTWWIDIEPGGWGTDKAKNKKFIEDFAKGLKAKGKSAGIYTNYNFWMTICGLDYSGMSHLPLWYTHADNKAACSDFKPFGGWKKPKMKQYTGTTSLCSGSVDLNIEC